MRSALLLAPLILPVAAVGGCSDSTMQTLGLQRNPPDEFQVTTQPVLAMPPDLNAAAATLPSPVPGAPRPQDVAVPQQAEDAMLGSRPDRRRPPTSARRSTPSPRGTPKARPWATG
jgi:Protein of unknown function (DUF3035)